MVSEQEAKEIAALLCADPRLIEMLEAGLAARRTAGRVALGKRYGLDIADSPHTPLDAALKEVLGLLDEQLNAIGHLSERTKPARVPLSEQLEAPEIEAGCSPLTMCLREVARRLRLHTARLRAITNELEF